MNTKRLCSIRKDWAKILIWWHVHFNSKQQRSWSDGVCIVLANNKEPDLMSCSVHQKIENILIWHYVHYISKQTRAWFDVISKIEKKVCWSNYISKYKRSWFNVIFINEEYDFMLCILHHQTVKVLILLHVNYRKNQQRLQFYAPLNISLWAICKMRPCQRPCQIHHSEKCY